RRFHQEGGRSQAPPAMPVSMREPRMRRRHTRRSTAAFADRRPDLGICDRAKALTRRHLRPERANVLDQLSHTFFRRAAFRNNPRDGLVMAGDYNLFASGNAVQDTAEPSLGIKCGNSSHKLTSQRLV